MTHRGIKTAAILVAAVALVGTAACESERERVYGQGAHPIGWAERDTPSFHGTFLRDTGYPLNECRACHGQDFGGGVTEVACSVTGACHETGVDDCNGTCHGDTPGPLPLTGAHPAHDGYCDTCHPVPQDLSPPHINLSVDIVFNGLAVDSAVADWDATTKTCTNTYCHVGDSPAWDSGTELTCDGCHQQSPKHDRFSRLVDESTCSSCHDGSPQSGHLDGTLSLEIPDCFRCHGTPSSKGAPAPALDGATDTSLPNVGAHRRHLDSFAPGRIAKVVACTRCHDVPSGVFSPGHLDDSAPADLDLINGDYDPTTHTCVVDCHFDRVPGPAWNDDSGDQRACDGCHAFPPKRTRIGTPHPSAPPDLDACLECHKYGTETHVDGQVSFQ